MFSYSNRNLIVVNFMVFHNLFGDISYFCCWCFLKVTPVFFRERIVTLIVNLLLFSWMNPGRLFTSTLSFKKERFTERFDVLTVCHFLFCCLVFSLLRADCILLLCCSVCFYAAPFTLRKVQNNSR